MVTTNLPWFCYSNHSLTMVYVVKLWLQMVINTPKKQGYYTFTSIKPWTMVHFRILIIKNILNINWAIQHLTMLKKSG